MSNFESIYILIYVVMAFTAFLLLLKDNSIGTNKLFIVFFFDLVILLRHKRFYNWI